MRWPIPARSTFGTGRGRGGGPGRRAMRRAQVPRHPYVPLRGEFRRRGPTVEPGTLRCLPPLPSAAEPNRLALARWLVAAENPLPARVAVNRFWQELFGRGLVYTSED